MSEKQAKPVHRMQKVCLKRNIFCWDGENLILTVFFSANLGGVYSLFVGMSVLSFIEIFYFFTVRFYKNYRQTKENETRLFTVKPNFLTKLDVNDLLVMGAPKVLPGSSDSKKTIVMGGFIN